MLKAWRKVLDCSRTWWNTDYSSDCDKWDRHQAWVYPWPGMGVRTPGTDWHTALHRHNNFVIHGVCEHFKGNVSSKINATEYSWTKNMMHLFMQRHRYCEKGIRNPAMNQRRHELRVAQCSRCFDHTLRTVPTLAMSNPILTGTCLQTILIRTGSVQGIISGKFEQKRTLTPLS